MKNMIKVLGLIFLVSAIGLPLFAQPAPPTESVEVLTPRPNAVSSLLHKNIQGFGRQYFPVDNLQDSVYYVLWRDADNSTNLTAPFADIRVSIVNITTNRVIIVLADIDRSLNTDNELNSILLRRGTHYNNGDSLLIIVESFENRGNYAIMVH